MLELISWQFTHEFSCVCGCTNACAYDTSGNRGLSLAQLNLTFLTASGHFIPGNSHPQVWPIVDSSQFC